PRRSRRPIRAVLSLGLAGTQAARESGSCTRCFSSRVAGQYAHARLAGAKISAVVASVVLLPDACGGLLDRAADADRPTRYDGRGWVPDHLRRVSVADGDRRVAGRVRARHSVVHLVAEIRR